MTRNKILAFLAVVIAIGSTFFFCMSVARNSLEEKSELAGERWETVQKYLKTRGEQAREIGKLTTDSAVAESVKTAAHKLESATDPGAAWQANFELSAVLLPVLAKDVSDANRYAEVLGELAQTDEKIEEAGKRYNEIVDEYNELLATAPVKFVAEKFDFQPLRPYDPDFVANSLSTEDETPDAAPESTEEESETDAVDFFDDDPEEI